GEIAAGALDPVWSKGMGAFADDDEVIAGGKGVPGERSPTAPAGHLPLTAGLASADDQKVEHLVARSRMRSAAGSAEARYLKASSLAASLGSSALATGAGTTAFSN